MFVRKSGLVSFPAARSTGTGSPRGIVHKTSRREDRDASEGIEREQIDIPRQDKVGTAAHSEFEKFVIGGIATCRNTLRDHHRLRCRQYFLQPVVRGGRNERGKVRAGQDVE